MWILFAILFGLGGLTLLILLLSPPQDWESVRFMALWLLGMGGFVLLFWLIARLTRPST